MSPAEVNYCCKHGERGKVCEECFPLVVLDRYKSRVKWLEARVVWLERENRQYAELTSPTSDVVAPERKS